MALIYAGIRCELREVALADKPAAMLEISPKGTVPVLQLADGEVLEESLEIMLWALKQADQQHWLMPPQTNDMLHLIERNDGDFKHHLDRYKYPNRHEETGNSNVYARQHRDAACEFIVQLETQLTATTFLFGNKPALADVAIFPFTRQFAANNPKWFSQAPYPRVQRWLQNWLDSDLFKLAMHKQVPWQAGDTPLMLDQRQSFAAPAPGGE